jgi:hypothetical protein
MRFYVKYFWLYKTFLSMNFMFYDLSRVGQFSPGQQFFLKSTSIFLKFGLLDFVNILTILYIQKVFYELFLEEWRFYHF